ncbi:MAG: adenylate kinase [Ferroplasma sp.]|jgi:adenylate kinase|uniref:adenylate kinase n=1 Tax=Ferroplasma sp. TaxID=2591003 RepID=UPI0028158F83|nr:adenylate kinase [Ferroplasma sp.]WMT51349.1 MAG: adenylate kinase [Ferroplasma sp.]
MRVVISGIPGVGKSTILEMVSKKTQYEIINFGTLMFDMAVDLDLVKSRDDIRRLDVDTQKNLQKKASNKIGKMDNIIIDTHMSIKSPAGYLPGLPEWVLRELMVSSYFLIESTPEEIKRRRDNDSTRSRDSDTVQDIKEHQEVNRYYAAAYSVYSGATIKYIYNPDNHPEIAAESILGGL